MILQSFINAVLMAVTIHSLPEEDIYHLVDVIEKRLDIKSIYCKYDINIQDLEEGKTSLKTVEIAWDGTNVYFFSIENFPENQREPNEKDNNSTPTNLLEILVKKLYYNQEEKQTYHIIESSLYKGKFLSCIGTYSPTNKKRQLGVCNEDNNTYNSKDPILAPWISRLSLLHLLGISFIPISKGGRYYGELDTPNPAKYLYKPLVVALKEDLKNKTAFRTSFFNPKENSYIIYFDSYFTSIWLDTNGNVVRIQQLPQYPKTLSAPHSFTDNEVNDIFNIAYYDCKYSRFLEFSNGVCIPLHIEFVRQTPNMDDSEPEVKKFNNKFDELVKSFPIESKEFSVNFQALQTQYIHMTLQRGMKIQMLVTIDIHPENLIVNEPLEESKFQIQIPDGALIYQGKDPDSPHYIYYREKKNNLDTTNQSGQHHKQSMIFLFVVSCIGITLLFLYITKRILGWGM